MLLLTLSSYSQNNEIEIERLRLIKNLSKNIKLSKSLLKEVKREKRQEIKKAYLINLEVINLNIRILEKCIEALEKPKKNKAKFT